MTMNGGAAIAPLTDADMQARVAAPWFQNAKLGIFIHWGLYSVPGWAPPVAKGLRGYAKPTLDLAQMPYAEWYLNALRMDGSPTRQHHVETYGEDFNYYDFQLAFEAANATWRADEWGKLFAESGARYAVLTSKHHEGYTLWPSAVPNDKTPGRHLTSKRDLVGEYVAAMRGAGLKAGIYYSGGIDWTFHEQAITLSDPQFSKLFTEAAVARKAGLPPPAVVLPPTQEYADYADQHLVELIDRYQPDVLWNDIGYPHNSRLREILAHYAQSVPAGVINDRFSTLHADVKTPEYHVSPKIDEAKWETCRGVGTSFGFNRNEGEGELLAPFDLIQMFVDVVSKNGNMLLDVGPRADGSIPANQQSRLRALGAWLSINGVGIYDTVPWKRAADLSPEGLDVRYTQSADAVYAFLLDRRGEDRVTLPGFSLAGDGKVIDLTTHTSLPWRQTDAGLQIALGPDDGRLVPTFRIVGAERADRRIPA